MGQRSLESVDAWRLWGGGFVYALLAALSLQWLILPLLPELHAGNGLLHRDAEYFHRVAAEMAAQIRAEGWSRWALYPLAPVISGQAGLLAALYALFAPEPALLIPFNAAAHALAAATLYRIGRRLWPGATGRLGGIIAALHFLIAPSALSWYGQTLKDSYFIAGLLLFVHVWLLALDCQPRAGTLLRVFGMCFVAVLLIIFVRPHYLKVLGVMWLLSWLAVLAAGFRWRRRRTLMAGIPVFAALLFGGALYELYGPHLSGDASRLPPAVHAQFAPLGMNWEWRASDWLPGYFDAQLRELTAVRALEIEHSLSVRARTAIDTDRLPADAGEALAYMPRALAIGLLAPFPDTWQQAPDAQRLIAGAETMFWYLLIPGVLILILSRPSRQLLAGAVLCLSLLTLLAYAQPNVGTLYRVRYAPHFFFILCGAVGWARVILQVIRHSERSRRSPLVTHGRLSALGSSAASGALVTLITGAGMLLFLIRDLFLLREWGAGPSLDAFFVAAMIPNVATAMLVAPLMDAVAPLLQRTGIRAGQGALVRRLLWLAMPVMLTASTFIWILAAPIAALMLGADAAAAGDAAHWLRWHVAVLPLSLLVMAANALLNAHGLSRQTAAAQLWPPTLTIVMVVLFLPAIGLYSAVSGLLLGLAINGLQAYRMLRREGMSWRQSWLRIPAPVSGERALLLGWAAMALVAVIAQLAVPVNFYLAGQLDAGSVSLWAMGSKINQGFGVLAGAAIGAVLLPFAGAVAAMRHRELLRIDTSFVLMTGTWLAAIVSTAVFVFSRPFVVVVLTGGLVSLEHADEVAQVFRLGGLQLPFLFANTLLLRLAATTRRLRQAVVASSVALAVNVALAVLLMPLIGLRGLAVATVAGSASGAALLLLQHGDRNVWQRPQVLAQMLFWTALVGLAMAIESGFAAAAAGCGLLLVVLPVFQWRRWISPETRVAH